MIDLLLASAIFSANQGSALQITFPNEAGVQSVNVIWEGKRVPAFLLNDAWTTIVGVDLDAKPGEHKADVLFTMEGGRVDKRDAVIKVVPKKYPTTELKVDEKYVELSKADLARANRESRETEQIYRLVTENILPNEPFTVPIAGGTGTNFGRRPALPFMRQTAGVWYWRKIFSSRETP